MTTNTIHFNSESFLTSGVIEYFPHKDEFQYKFSTDSGLINELESHIMESFKINNIDFTLASLQMDLCGAEFLAVGKLSIV